MSLWSEVLVHMLMPYKGENECVIECLERLLDELDKFRADSIVRDKRD